MTVSSAPIDTGQLFRSVRAARSWLRARAPGEETSTSGCVMMKPGNDEPPVFMIPGASGSILQLRPDRRDDDRADCRSTRSGPRGLAEGETPCEHLEAMAEHAIGVMRAMHRQGPYLLAGYSAGGLVALEMARQLAAAGLDVPLVVLLDTYPSREVWPLSCHVEILARQAAKALWALRQLTLRQAVADIGRRIRSLFLYLTASGIKLVTPPPLVAEGTDAASRRVHLATFNAGEAYRPSPYSGKVVFLQPEVLPNLEPREPRRVWAGSSPNW